MKDLLKQLGNVCAVIGAQWGDEGKGKIVDILGEHFDVVARACGGANAGHTIKVNGKKHVFRLLPSGSLHGHAQVVLGAGMVIHLPTLLEEIDMLESAGIPIRDRLVLSPKAHIVFDFHKDIDAVLEERRSQAKGEGIGTTKRGIGPAYMDKAARRGIRLEHLNQNVEKELKQHADDVRGLYGVTVDVEKEWKQVEAARRVLESKIKPVDELLHHAVTSGKKILIEGAQATLLDIDHGTYPYVTSSSTTLAGALQGLGLAPKHVKSCIGVAKAYCTRVGSGTFATEETGETGNRLRERGGEYGSVTGRPRRCGWLFLPDLKYAAMLNGFDCWNITKLDVLDTEDTIPVGMEMNADGTVRYEMLPGWKTSTVGITDFAKLPKNAQKFLQFIDEQTGIFAQLVGTGQGREEMIVR